MKQTSNRKLELRGRLPAKESTSSQQSTTPPLNKRVLAAPINKSKSELETNRKKLVILRVLFVMSLLVVIVISTAIPVKVIQKLEIEMGQHTYESIAQGALDAAKVITKRKINVCEIMESIMSHAFPDADQWPMIGLNGYQEVATTVAGTSGDTSVALITLVKPEEALAFEAHAKEHYESQGYPEEAGSVDGLGFGIRYRDAESPSGYTIDHSGMTHTYETNNTGILTPVLDHSAGGTANMLMYNIHHSSTAVDRIIECSKKFQEAGPTNSNNETSPSHSHSPNCTVVTGFKLTATNDLVALIYYPIYPENDPSTLVGVMGLSVNFKDVLVNVVPKYFDGVSAVLSTHTSTSTLDHSTVEYDTVTYEIKDGIPVFVGEGDHHDPSFERHGKSVVLNDQDTDVADAVIYTLTFYPSTLDQFTTHMPLAVSLGFVLVVLISTALFLLYDFLMRRHSNEQKIILDLKRRFIRFISHEIRTPLNTVSMGLELLDAEIQSHRALDEEQHLSSSELKDVEAAPADVNEGDVSYWHEITHDIQENAATAVSILNDLLNYDKIESGTLKLEVETVNIIDLVIRNTRKFKVQAAHKDIHLSMQILPCRCRLFPGRYPLKDPLKNAPDAMMMSTDLDNVMVVGDDMRLGQVVCNLLSNALKFTPRGGSISVCMEHFSPPDCTPLRRCGSGSDCESNKYVTCNKPQRGSVRISVRDSGVGMSAEQVSRVFAEGVQFEANKLQGGGGSGLGLSISKAIVEKHNGYIQASSEGPDHGSMFSVELPLYDFIGTSQEFTVDSKLFQSLSNRHDSFSHKDALHNEDSTATTTIEHMDYQSGDHTEFHHPDLSPGSETKVLEISSHFPKHETEEKAPAGPEKAHHVLVVEDSMPSQKMLVRLLERMGCTCVAACNGQEAVDAVKSTIEGDVESGVAAPFDTILMDYEMPILNGPDATEIIREMGYKGIIFGVTGNVLPEDVEFFLSKGADDILGKPLRMNVLKGALQNDQMTPILEHVPSSNFGQKQPQSP